MPFISVSHLKLLKEKLLQFQISTLACPFVNIDEAKNSSKVKVTIDQLNYASNFSRILDSNLKINKNVFHHIGVYGYKVSFLKKFSSLPNSKLEKIEKLEQLRALENGYDIHVLEVKTFEAWGIDTPEDLEKFRNHITEIESN